MRVKFTTLRVFFVVICSAPVLHSQRIDVQSKSTAGLGWTPWYEMHVDPDNARNMIVCGTKSDVKDNAWYGFVYSSSDGGKSWRTAMEDKNSLWVSEQSCAYGVHGVAYFVADASKVIDGDLHHELGTTRIYMSHDSGQTWKFATSTGWTDWSTSVVDTKPGSNQNRLYVFFNNLREFYSSIGDKDALEAEEGKGSRVGMISYSDGDTRVAGPFTGAEMAKEGYRGSYPAPSFLLNDGSIITFFFASRRTVKGSREMVIEAVRTTSDRTALEVPVKIADSQDNPEYGSGAPCAGYGETSGGAYDSLHNNLYFAYPDVHDKKCSLMLTASTDGGKSWSKAEQLYSPNESAERRYADPSLAVNKDGVLGVLWHEQSRSSCWKFAASTDGGKSLSRSRDLSACSGEWTKPGLLSSAYLMPSFSQADPDDKSGSAKINLRNTRNSGEPHEHGVAVTPDGAFHPVWIEPGSGEGQIRTATVRVEPADSLISAATVGLQDVTNKVAVLYGGDQSYDSISRLITLEVTIKNNSDQPLRVPLKLAASSANERGGLAEVANADNRATGAGAVWDLSATVSGDRLAPGATSKPFPLKFRYLANPETPRDSDDILGLSVKVFAAK